MFYGVFVWVCYDMKLLSTTQLEREREREREMREREERERERERGERERERERVPSYDKQYLCFMVYSFGCVRT